MEQFKVEAVVRGLVQKMLKQREDQFGPPCTDTECPRRKQCAQAKDNVVPIKKRAY